MIPEKRRGKGINDATFVGIVRAAYVLMDKRTEHARNTKRWLQIVETHAPDLARAADKIVRSPLKATP